MTLSNIIIILGLVCTLSIVFNIISVIYMRRVLLRVYNASEEASVIFTRLDTFREHLNSVYKMPTFYGDETLNALLQHVKDLTDFLMQYENIYSFTQPDLMEQLEEVSREIQEDDEQKENPTQKEEQ